MRLLYEETNKLNEILFSNIEILDELGIIVRLDQAALDYATSLGKTANQLSQFEKVQAFVNATITQGLTKYQKIISSCYFGKLRVTFVPIEKDEIKFLKSCSFCNKMVV